MQCTRNVQRAGPKQGAQRQRSCFSSLSLSLFPSLSSPFSYLLFCWLIETFSAPVPRRAKVALVLLSLSLLFTVFSFLLSSHHFRSPLSLSFTDRTRERAFGTQRQRSCFSQSLSSLCSPFSSLFFSFADGSKTLRARKECSVCGPFFPSFPPSALPLF